jgi:hypothetical protein
MGLDTTHEAWHGAYSAFSRWRDKLAQVAGYTFHAFGELFKLGDSGMEVMGTARVQVDLDWGGIESVIGRDLLGKWPRMPVRHDGTPDPLIVLLAHSDCEGEIQTEFCGPLADRLQELLPLLGDEDGGGHVGSYATKTQTFIDGLRAAAKAGEDLGFH